jgi:MerR family transcriptional regulator, redox-sensitive transcriptional activator SoxR
LTAEPVPPEVIGGLLIGEVARRSGHTVATLRHWEMVGLLQPPPRWGGKRVFPETVLTRIKIIDLARRAGFRLEEIRLLLAPGRADREPGARWRAVAAPKRAELNELRAAVDAMCRLLDHLAGCQCSTLEECATRTTDCFPVLSRRERFP